MFLLSLLLAAFAGASYHFLTKTLPEFKYPFASLVVSYLAAAAICLILAALFSGKDGKGAFAAAFRSLNVKSVLVGLALIGIDSGVFFLYRLGGEVSVISILTSALQSLLLVLIGILVFRERVTPTNVLGMVLSLGGVYFLTR